MCPIPPHSLISKNSFQVFSSPHPKLFKTKLRAVGGFFRPIYRCHRLHSWHTPDGLPSDSIPHIDSKGLGGLEEYRTLDILELVRIAAELKIVSPINMMIGFPDETEAEIKNSITCHCSGRKNA